MTENGKFYLGGLDWMVQTMWRATMRRTGGVGNASQIVLQLNGVLDADKFVPAVKCFASAFPILQGRKSRDALLQPFWIIPEKAASPDIRVEVHRVESETVFKILEKLVNTRFLSTHEYVVLHLLMTGDGECWLSIVFDHRLLDARGAEQFMLLLNRYLSGEIALDDIDALPSPAKTNVWTQIKEGFSSARCVGQTIHKSVIGSGMIRLDETGKYKGNSGRFLIHTFSEEETRDWMERVDRDAGYLMFMPYALAAASSAFGKIRSLQNREGSFIIPCTTDLRQQGLNWKNTFFNYCSFFFFKADSRAVSNRDELISTFKTQFFSQTKSGFPRAFERFMALMRVLPLPLFEWMNSWNQATFSVGVVGKSLFEGELFGGLKINNLFHMPLIPPHVGLGFFFSQINGRLSLGISWREGTMNEQEIKAVEKAFLEF